MSFIQNFINLALLVFEIAMKKTFNLCFGRRPKLKGGTPEGEVWRMERKVEAFVGEASEGVHELIQLMAVSSVKGEGLNRGRENDKAEVGVVVGQARRLLW